MNEKLVLENQAKQFSTTSGQPFCRDRLTWLGYLLMACYCFVSASIGPLMPFLRFELGFSYTVAAFHFSALALGALIAGSTGDWWMKTLGLRRLAWLAALGVAGGALIVILGWNPLATIVGVLTAGFFGSLLSQDINTVLCRRFHAHRALGITELSVAASVAASMAPTSVALFVVCGLGWRAAFVLSMLTFAVLWFMFRSISFPDDGAGQSVESPGTLPLAYWAYWCVVLFGAAGEWSINFWSAEFLKQVGGLTKTDAAGAVSIFFCAMLAGRVVGSRLCRSFPVTCMLPYAALFSVFGFLMLWLGSSTLMRICGLFVTGLGAANVYPFAFAAGMATAPESSSRASARMSLAFGISVLSMPLLLGSMADRVGIFTAFGLAFVAFLLVVAMAFLANRLASRDNVAANATFEAVAVPLDG